MIEVIELVKALGPGWPWWASLCVVLAWLIVYICRQVGLYRLCSKALDKVRDDRVPDVVTAFMGPGGGERRRKRAPVPPSADPPDGQGST